MLEFEWDDAKAESNLRKHGVTFEDAARAFDDLYGFDVSEAFHDDERRIVLLGMAGIGLLAVTYTYRIERIRIISARKASRYEQGIYARNRQE